MAVHLHNNGFLGAWKQVSKCKFLKTTQLSSQYKLQKREFVKQWRHAHACYEFNV